MRSAPFARSNEPLQRVAADPGRCRQDRATPAASLRPEWLGGRRVSVVIPAMNEAECLPHVLPRLPPWIDEVLLVDGASTDATVEVARRIRPDVRIVAQQGRGKGAAL